MPWKEPGKGDKDPWSSGGQQPPDLEEVILQCLAKAPAGRFPSAAAMGSALAECTLADRWTRDDAHRWWKDADREVPAGVDAETG